MRHLATFALLLGVLAPALNGRVVRLEIAERRPATEAELARIHGMDDPRIARFGADFLAAIADTEQ